jgi:hypothetical protein
MHTDGIHRPLGRPLLETRSEGERAPTVPCVCELADSQLDPGHDDVHEGHIAQTSAGQLGGADLRSAQINALESRASG